jgi:hypothetical protein
VIPHAARGSLHEFGNYSGATVTIDSERRWISAKAEVKTKKGTYDF